MCLADTPDLVEVIRYIVKNHVLKSVEDLLKIVPDSGATWLPQTQAYWERPLILDSESFRKHLGQE